MAEDQTVVELTTEDMISDVRSGKTLAYRFSGQLINFSRAMAALGDEYICVGFPTDGAYGGYVNCSYCCSVNAKSEHKEIAYDFLQYLLSDKVQQALGYSTVRRDILTNNVIEGAAPGEQPFLRLKNGCAILDGKPDGTSFLPEYLEILENGKWQPTWVGPGTLGNIILEESAPFFNGDKSAQEAAKIIQSRVWLYLNE